MNHDYSRIASAIEFISANVVRQPSLEEIAAHVHLSPFHFQRMFTEWAGVSPKRFLQYLTVGYAKSIISGTDSISLVDTAEKLGLSGTGRLHDLFITIEGMTPGEYRQRGKGLNIHFSINECRFGKYLVASTEKGICDLHFFENDPSEALTGIKKEWYGASISEGPSMFHDAVTRFFNRELRDHEKIKMHLHGTGFQLKVWQALLHIPEGGLSTYGAIADMLGNHGASRAVGSAIGSNHIAFLIPCHRVIRNAGVIGDFRWGTVRKKAMIAWEAAHMNAETSFVD